jgi:hypothetical protein
MDTQEYLVIASAFLLALGAGYAANQTFQNSSEAGFSKELSLRVDSETPTAYTEFDDHYIELRYEDTDKAKFYYKFNDTRNVQQIEGLKHDGKLQNFRDIKSFGNQTYFLYLRYMDQPNQSNDGYMELYRIEET